MLLLYIPFLFFFDIGLQTRQQDNSSFFYANYYLAGLVLVCTECFGFSGFLAFDFASEGTGEGEANKN